MNARVLFRAAAVLLVLFALGHTIGFLKFRPPTASALAVWNAMNNVRFSVQGTTFSYARFYVGFGLFVTAYLLFSAALSWQLGSLATQHAGAISGLSWTFFGLQAVTVVLSWLYFSAAPIAFAAVIAACVGAAARSLHGGASQSAAQVAR